MRWGLIAYGLLCVGLWFVPVLGLLHVESAAVVAAVAWFVAGLSALRTWRQAPRASFGRVLVRQEAALLVPWALLTLSLLWRPNCGYAQGLLFFVLFPPFTVGLAVAVAYALAGVRVRRRRALFCGLGVGLMLLGPAYDLGLHPQFYTYNHVFGGVLGPIYDEELAVRPGLFAFRGLTALWAVFAYALGRWLRARRGRRPSRLATRLAAGAALAIGAAYASAGPLGINTPAPYLQRALGAVVRTPHFDIYFDPEALSEGAVRRLAEDHEYRYAWLRQRLGVEVDERVASYLYASPEQKAALTGARLTSVAPVWLARPQVHVLLPSYAHVFPHELAHVFSRPAGGPLNASVAVGLVEGWAVALEPPDGRPTPHEQVVVAALARADTSGLLGLGDAVASRLSPFGFWTGRGAVSYTTMGSFVRFLLDAYGPEPLRDAYAWGRFEAAYGKPLEVLAAEWEAFLLDLPHVSAATAALAEQRFSVPSLFEKPCPHYVPRYRRRYREALAALAAGDLGAAQEALESSLALQPRYLSAWATWGYVRNAAGAPAEVLARLDTLEAPLRTVPIQVALGDAHALVGRADEARRQYDAALERLPQYARPEKARLLLRGAVADEPEAVRALLPLSAEARAGALPPETPAAQVLRALAHLEAGQPSEALDGWPSTAALVSLGRTPLEQELLQRQGLAWRGQILYHAGAYAAAAAYARRAAEAAAAVGDFRHADAMADFADKMEWLQAHPAAVRAPA